MLVNGVLQVDMAWDFVANNVVRIIHTCKNVSGTLMSAAKLRRIAQVEPDLFWAGSMVCTVDGPPLIAPVDSATPYRFAPGVTESSNPANGPFNGATTGGVFSGGNFGGGMEIALGALAVNQSAVAEILYAITAVGQTQAQLRSQLTALGVVYMLSWVPGNDDTTEFALPLAAAMGFVPSVQPAPPAGEPAIVWSSHWMRQKRQRWKNKERGRLGVVE